MPTNNHEDIIQELIRRYASSYAELLPGLIRVLDNKTYFSKMMLHKEEIKPEEKLSPYQKWERSIVKTS